MAKVRILIFTLVLFFSLNVHIHGFYLPGVAPQDFQMVSHIKSSLYLYFTNAASS